jgi:uncharacterized membrane protein
MKFLANIFLKGFLFTLPLTITFGLIYWLFDALESVLKIPLVMLLPEGQYITGMGVASALVLIFCAGILVQAYVLRQIFAWFDLLLERIPLVKTLYTSTRDLLHFMAGNKESELQKVVLVTLDSDVRLLGFVTCEDVSLGSQHNLLAVYLPKAYQIGGFTVYLPKERCEFLDISAEQAMQHVLTAHVTRPD